MKKINIFSFIFILGMLLIGGTAFTSCNEEDDLDTNQYGTGTKLLAYGPSPVARGGQLRFLGSGLDKVTAVVIPGCSEITDIERVSAEEIRVTVPQDAEPGYVTLKTSVGDLKTLTRLTFTEPVGFDESGAITPNPVKAGETLTISGEYLNLVTTVILADEVEVSDFLTHSRKEISFVVPAEAQTGKVTLSFVATGDTIANEILSDEILEVAAPAVESVVALDKKKPGDEVTIKGTDMDLVTAVVMDATGDSIAFECTETSVKFNMPANVTNSVISVRTASNLTIAIATVGVALPEVAEVSPNTDLRANNVITITGTNLELVTGVSFPTSGDDVTVGLEPGAEPEKIQVRMPETAISGTIKLLTAANISVDLTITTAKPAIDSYSPNPVSAGSEITISGKNLDLVKTITFASDLTVDPTATEYASLKATVPVAAVTGKVVVTMTNGETADFGEISIDSPVFCFIPELPGDDVEIKAGAVMTVKVLNGDKLTNVQIDGEDCHYILDGESLMIKVPESAGSSSVIKLISSNGEVEYNYAFIPNTQQKRVVWDGMTTLSWGDGGRVFVPKDAFDDVPEGAILTLCYTQEENAWGCAQINDGWWGSIKSWAADAEAGCDGFTGADGNLIPTDVYGWFSDGQLNRETNFLLTAEMLELIKSHTGDNGSLIIQGQGLTFTKVYISWTISLAKDIKEFTKWEDQSDYISYPFTLSWSANKFRIMRDGLQALKLKSGKSKFLIYKNGTGQFQLNNANWSCILTAADWTGDQNPIEIVFNDDMMKCVDGTVSDGWSNTAFIVQGDGLEITKITVE